jgi:dihydroorotase/N-acyl-D-amino-acid deacylase
MKTRLSFICIIPFLAAILAFVWPVWAQQDYDVLIKGGMVSDGSGDPAARADIAVKDGKIVQVGQSLSGTAAQIIDAKGLHVTPGFIDLHSHVDRGLYYPETRAALNYLKQGVTSAVIGQCGSSAWPIFDKAADQMQRWTDAGIGPNVAMLVGHGSVRRIAMGMDDREPTADELEKMKELVKEAMDQGAAGLSTGLIYRPGSFAETDEVIELVKIIVPYGGLYHTHIRNEGDDLLDAIREAIHICETTGARTNISHFKAIGEANWGDVKEAAGLLEEARARGLEITADQYPYPYTNNNPYMTLIPRHVWLGDNVTEVLQLSDIGGVLDHLRDDELIELYNKSSVDPLISEQVPQYLDALPRKELVSLVAREMVNMRAMQGATNPRERALFLERMNHPEEAEWVREEVRKYVTNGLSPKYIMIGICPIRKLEGKSLEEAAEIIGKSLEDTAIELALMDTLAVAHRISEQDLEYIMQKDYVATGSDGAGPPLGIGNVHSRSYTTFLNKIKKYAQERKAISVAHAVRSQTSLPAQIMNLSDRGWIKEGYAADIAVIDLENIQTDSDISQPHEYSEGVEYLLVNGEMVIEKGEFTGKLPGKVLKLK